jgi:hypothetical protein
MLSHRLAFPAIEVNFIAKTQSLTLEVFRYLFLKIKLKVWPYENGAEAYMF